MAFHLSLGCYDLLACSHLQVENKGIYKSISESEYSSGLESRVLRKPSINPETKDDDLTVILTYDECYWRLNL